MLDQTGSLPVSFSVQIIYRISYRIVADIRAGVAVKASKSMYTDAGNVVLVAETLAEQTVAYFPGEDRRTLALVLSDAAHDVRCSHARFTAANRTRSNRPRLVVATQDLTHAAVRHLQHRTTYHNNPVTAGRGGRPERHLSKKTAH